MSAWPRLVALLGLLGALLVLPGCATLSAAQQAGLQAALADGLPPQAERRAVPFFAQTRYHCGPAALATVLADAGLSGTPEQLADEVFLPAREGALQAEMLAGARRHGALAVRIPGTLAAALREVAAGHAVLVLQNLGLAIAPRWHYAVLVGYDLGAGQVMLRSGTTEREVLSLATFEHTWARSGHWAFVALPPGRWPVSATEAEGVQAAIGFERVAPPAQALKAYESALQRWPDNALAGLGLGNARYQAGDKPGAAAAFESTARRQRSAAAWINLGEVALELGQRDKAAAAAREALALGGAWAEQAQDLLLRAGRSGPAGP